MSFLYGVSKDHPWLRGKVQFLTKEDEKDETYDDFDFFLYTKLMDARDLVFQILQDRSLM